MREPPIDERSLLLAALTGRPDGRRGKPALYPAFAPTSLRPRLGFVQLAYRDRQTARRLERAGLLDPDETRWRLPPDLAFETGRKTYVAIGCWKLTPLGLVVARACAAGRI